MDSRGLERAIKLSQNMFEHFFDANSPFAGLVSVTDPCPCTGLPPLILFGRGYVFAKDVRTEHAVFFWLFWLAAVQLLTNDGEAASEQRAARCVLAPGDPGQRVAPRGPSGWRPITGSPR
jgi:hypothetical protein